MANVFIKATRVVNTALGQLEREIVLPGMVWRDAGGSFAGVKDDTISIRVPAFTVARTRVLRAGTTIVVDDLAETKVDVTLNTDVYKAVKVTDEQMTLDITDFGLQINTPIIASVARGVEDAVATVMQNTSYETTFAIDVDDPYIALVDARLALNNAYVPMGGRGLAVGSSIEGALLKSDRLSKFDLSGSSDAFREAVIGRIAGFTAVSAPGLDPDTAIAFHTTAFVLSMQAPVVPAGASWGTTQTYNGMALRMLRDYDFTNTSDRVLGDVYIGSNAVKDNGTLDGDGRFTPDADEDPIMVRAVKLHLSGS